MPYSPLTNTQLAAKSTNLSASALIHTDFGNVQGIVINSHASGTVKLWDSLTASGTVLFNTISFSNITVTGERWIPLFGAQFLTGLYATIGGAADITIIYN